MHLSQRSHIHSSRVSILLNIHEKSKMNVSSQPARSIIDYAFIRCHHARQKLSRPCRRAANRSTGQAILIGWRNNGGTWSERHFPPRSSPRAALASRSGGDGSDDWLDDDGGRRRRRSLREVSEWASECRRPDGWTCVSSVQWESESARKLLVTSRRDATTTATRPRAHARSREERERNARGS